MGVDKVLCVTVDAPAAVAELAARPTLQHKRVGRAWLGGWVDAGGGGRCSFGRGRGGSLRGQTLWCGALGVACAVKGRGIAEARTALTCRRRRDGPTRSGRNAVWMTRIALTGHQGAAPTRCSTFRANRFATSDNPMQCVHQVELLADKNGGLVRLLGLEIGAPEAGQGPKCQRYAAVVEDGVLLKLVGGALRRSGAGRGGAGWGGVGRGGAGQDQGVVVGRWL